MRQIEPSYLGDGGIAGRAVIVSAADS